MRIPPFAVYKYGMEHDEEIPAYVQDLKTRLDYAETELSQLRDPKRSRRTLLFAAVLTMMSFVSGTLIAIGAWPGFLLGSVVIAAMLVVLFVPLAPLLPRPQRRLGLGTFSWSRRKAAAPVRISVQDALHADQARICSDWNRVARDFEPRDMQ